MDKSVFTAAYRTLLAELRAARKEAGLTQTELGKLIGEDQSFIAKVERGVRRIDAVELFVIMRALEANAFTILRRVERELNQTIETGGLPAAGAKRARRASR